LLFYGTGQQFASEGWSPQAQGSLLWTERSRGSRANLQPSLDSEFPNPGRDPERISQHVRRYSGCPFFLGWRSIPDYWSRSRDRPGPRPPGEARCDAGVGSHPVRRRLDAAPGSHSRPLPRKCNLPTRWARATTALATPVAPSGSDNCKMLHRI